MIKLKTIVPAFLAFAAFLASGVALADHNSPSGEGTANMPNDIHNTRVDTLDDNDTFLAFVQGGGGADSTNRFLDDDSTVSVGGGGMGPGAGAGGMGGGYGGGR
ncbi:hypothetical protein D5687_01155 [Guyparkeria sp. SCN-R1]|uniref:hypothetical protein n=1 Tax=Guyparkeria sp. SCN-R1 TaxID=2341113 RepID=UPI000F64CCD1|nr:hypothetical protein [Guyparkeria sp. SCN-R1]RRQ24789.1 hypothetical protein D5687_01155 [Guyparkeria sp. SCN-R1]